jgi:antitoxin HicB
MPGVRSYAIVLEPDVEGGFTAIVPALPGVVTEGDTIEEVLANAREAVELCLEDLQASGDVANVYGEACCLGQHQYTVDGIEFRLDRVHFARA